MLLWGDPVGSSRRLAIELFIEQLKADNCNQVKFCTGACMLDGSAAVDAILLFQVDQDIGKQRCCLAL